MKKNITKKKLTLGKTNDIKVHVHVGDFGQHFKYDLCNALV